MSEISKKSTLEFLHSALGQEVTHIREKILELTTEELEELVMVMAMIDLDRVDPNFVASRHIVGRAGSAILIMEAIEGYYSG